MKPVIYLALSGGVDSAVAAVLLLERGYDVRGVFLKIWSDSVGGEKNYNQCTWVQDRQDAMVVAAKLQIPFITLDFQQDYKDEVFSYFINEYKRGRTPNPDILCNSVIKFGKFLDYAQKNGADYIATGHHVKRAPEQGNDSKQIYRLLSGIDKEKDQSYFLSGLTQDQLRYTLFPVGNYTKMQVREIAKQSGLDMIADKQSTRGICFVGKVDLKHFISNYTDLHPGDIVSMNGEKLGTHGGIEYYTIGQRKFLSVPVRSNKARPYFVVYKNANTSQLVVSHNENDLLKRNIQCSNIHWISGTSINLPLTCQARIRYRQTLQNVILELKTSTKAQYIVKFDQPVRAVAPGQIVAFYNNNELLGSAIIN